MASEVTPELHLFFKDDALHLRRVGDSVSASWSVDLTPFVCEATVNTKAGEFSTVTIKLIVASVNQEDPV